MSPFRGAGRTRPMRAEQQQVFGGIWKSGTGDVELIDRGASGDVAWLVMVERASVRFSDGSLVDVHTIDEVRGLLV